MFTPVIRKLSPGCFLGNSIKIFENPTVSSVTLVQIHRKQLQCRTCRQLTVVIKNGNYNEDVVISNVMIRDFQTHGIQLNGYHNVLMEDLEIGPSTNKAFLNGNYGQLRALLPTLRRIAAQKPLDTISFNGREHTEYTMQDLLDRLEPAMLSAFEWALAAAAGEHAVGEPVDVPDDPEAALFANGWGLSYGAVTYGIFLNYPSAGIFGWHVNDARSEGATLRKVHIHDITRKGKEVIGLAQRGRVYCNAFNGPLPLVEMLGDMERVRQFADALLFEGEQEVVAPQYVGDIVTDVHVAMFEFGRDDFDHWAGIPYFGEHQGLLQWAKGENPGYLSSDDGTLSVYCNNDAMFHPSKGLVGIKVSGSNQVELDGVTVSSLVDLTDFGHDLCGKKDLYHFSQQSPYQIGFCMNMVHGVAIDFSAAEIKGDGLRIDGIYSRTGLAFAVSTWFDTQIRFESKVEIKNVYARFGDEGDRDRDEPHDLT